MLTVEKIGGTSMSKFGDVLRNIITGNRKESEYYNRIFVVSAYSNVTNWLLEHKKTGDPGIYEFFARNGDYQSELDALRAAGTISEAEYAQFSKRSIDTGVAAQIKPYLERVQGALKQSMTSLPPKLLQRKDLMAELALRHGVLMDELEAALVDEVSANPGLLQDPALLSQRVSELSSALLQRPEFTMDLQGRWAAPLRSNDGMVERFTAAPGVQDFSRIPVEALFTDPKAAGPTLIPRSEMQPNRDRFLDSATLKADVKAVLANKPDKLSARTRAIAQGLGISPTALIEGQLRARGLPSLNVMRQRPEAQAQISGLRISSAREGMSVLQTTFRFPRKGAAYLAGNIQQESGWNGKRTWGQVAGDGSYRNGGLVSWMDPSASTGRLRRIEAHLGKSITKASHAEQLAAMTWEMKQFYPDAYRVFMNPNATDSELKAASYRYWGWGELGARWKYAQNLLSR